MRGKSYCRIILSLMKLRLRYILTLCFLLCATAQMQASDYVFRNLTSTDGLSGMLINAIYKDNEGYVWLGTDNGVDRFDGLRIRNYSFEGVGQATKKMVHTIVASPTGQLYVGNGLGLWTTRESSMTLVRRYQQSINCSVNALLADGKTLYVGTDNGLYVVKDDQVSVHRIVTDIWAASNRISDMQIDPKNRCIWISTQDGLARYNIKNGTFNLYRQPKEQPDNVFRCLAIAGQEIYVGSSHEGLLVFDTVKKQFARGPMVGSNVISDICTDGRGTIFVGTDGNGIHLVSQRDKTVIHSYQHSPGTGNQISSNSVYSLMVDPRGMLWVGTYRTGLDYTLYRQRLFDIYRCEPNFTSAYLTVNSVSQNGSNRLIGTRDGLFLVDEQQRSVYRFSKEELPSQLILSTIFYNGLYYIGTYGGGILSLSPATRQLRAVEGLPTSGHGFSMTISPQGELWIGTSAGVYIMNSSHQMVRHYDSSNSQLPSGNVYTIAFDSSGKGWIAAEAGLGLYDPSKRTIRADVFPENFANKDKIRCIYEDHRHNIYFAREKGNLFVSTLTMDKFGDVDLPFIRRANDNFILTMVEDASHNYWFACSEGLFRMKDLNADAYDLFTFNDGLPSQMFTNNSTSIAPNGNLCFGNTKGWVTIDPKKLDLKHHHTKVVITNILVNGAETNRSNTLSYNENNLSFHFSDMSFSSPGATYYECMLEGYDDDWHILAATGQAVYNNLPSGTYTFHVRTPGLADTEANFTFTIHPLVAWWMWILIIAAAAIIIYIIMCRIRRTKKAEPASTATEPQEESATSKNSKPLLSTEESEALKRRLVAYMEKEKPYTNKNLKSSDVATELGVSLNALSYVLNQYMSQSFNDFINEYRVNEFKSIATDPQYSYLTLSALSEKCGFGSHASFFRTFKKVTGITPNEYLQQVRQ